MFVMRAQTLEHTDLPWLPLQNHGLLFPDESENGRRDHQKALIIANMQTSDSTFSRTP